MKYDTHTLTKYQDGTRSCELVKYFSYGGKSYEKTIHGNGKIKYHAERVENENYFSREIIRVPQSVKKTFKEYKGK